MVIKRVRFENYTVFEKQSIEFCPGINVLIGENGTGKTHLLKALYSACRSVDKKTSFPQKLVMTMLPDDYKISRLVTRKPGNCAATIRVAAGERGGAQEKILVAAFSCKTKSWLADVKGEEGWEDAFGETSTVFIPAKEIISHSYKLNAASASRNVRFDDTYLDIIDSAKIDISSGRNERGRASMLKMIESVTHGVVTYDADRDEFYLKNGHSRQEFNLVAEGIRKMGLLWQLVKNGTLEHGAILFWDEPEANINPACIALIVELLLELQRKGVQIFVSTHDYLLASYFGVKIKKDDSILYHSLALDDKGRLQYRSSLKFSAIENNSIIASFNQLLNEIYNMEV